jgi:phage baseplate assembly protein W|tara:strand:+ start:258 stop:659 length:402 start_codon:yes stop_codon:yes gene_type:complete
VPAQRVSKVFKDVSASFQINPLNYDLIALHNENAIARSIRNLILTIPGERPFNPALGSEVYRLLFENFDQQTAFAIKTQIQTTISNFEPRVKIESIDVTPDFDSHEFNVTITYNIIGIESDTQQLQFALEPTR